MKHDVKQRIDARSIPEPNSGCWLWLGRVYESRPGHEYGTFYVKGRKTSVHRASYEAYREQIPSGMVCRHRCDNSLCVNPHHLEIGTQADNVADMFARGRSHHQGNEARAIGLRAAAAGNDTLRKEPARRARGSRHGMHGVRLSGESNGFARLSSPDVAEIRMLGPYLPQRAIAAMFGVTQRTVWRVIHLEGWRHV